MKMKVMSELSRLVEETDLKIVVSYFENDLEYFGSEKDRDEALGFYLSTMHKLRGFKTLHNRDDSHIGFTLGDTSVVVKFQELSGDDLSSILDDTKDLVFGPDQLKVFSFKGFDTEAVFDLTESTISLLSIEYLEQILLLPMSKVLPETMFDLYKFNLDTYFNILSILNKKDKACVVQPTGTGKMRLMIALSLEYVRNNKRVLVVSPRTELNDQMSRHSKVEVSDNIDYSTYIGLDSTEDKEQYDLILFDEFHRIEADCWKENVIRVLELHPNSKVVGFSATPKREDGVNVREFFDNNMARDMSLFDAINRGYLIAPKFIQGLYSISEDMDKHRDLVDSSSLSSTQKNKLMKDLDDLASWENTVGSLGSIIKTYIPNTVKKTIAFYSNISELDRLRKYVHKSFIDSDVYDIDDIRSYSIHSKISGKKQSVKLDSYIKDNSHGANILHTVDKFNEGLHLPELNLAILLRDTASKIIFFQQIGRPMSSGKGDTYIIDLANSVKNSNILDFQNELNESKKDLNVEDVKNGLRVENKDPVVVDVTDLTVKPKELFSEIKSIVKKGK